MQAGGQLRSLNPAQIDVVLCLCLLSWPYQLVMDDLMRTRTKTPLEVRAEEVPGTVRQKCLVSLRLVNSLPKDYGFYLHFLKKDNVFKKSEKVQRE